MKTTDRILILILSATVLLGACSRVQLLPLSADQVINETGYGQAMHWFDENDTTAIPLTSWETPGQESYWPASLVIDLGEPVWIDHLKVFDGAPGSLNESGDWEHRGGALVLSTGSPFHWKEVARLSLENTHGWLSLPVKKKLRYLQLRKESTESYYWNEYGPYHCDLQIGEVVLAGRPGRFPQKNAPPVGAAVKQKARFPMQDFMGANSYKWIPDELNGAVGIIRDYHHWITNGELHSDSALGWTSRLDGSDLDLYYRRVAEKGLFETFPDIHRHADPALPGEDKPCFGGDPDLPASYRVLGSYFFQYAARYGHTRVEADLLQVKAGEEMLTGMGWLNYYECWNEPDRWWGIPEAHFTPYQLAAMSSAAYDGHLGSMGEGVGVKNADPHARLVLGGLTSLDLQYMDAMLLWTAYHRDGSFPADVINFHHYSNTAGNQHQGADVKGISPEADSLRERLEELVRWRNRHLPDCELWLSEFGWDTHPASSQAANGHTRYPDTDIFYLQAIWLVRGYLAGAAAGIDRMFMYLANDLETDGLYRNCGLLYRDYSPKLSWYYVSGLKHFLTDTFFEGEMDSGQQDVRIYRFLDADREKVVLALWCPTSDGSELADFAVKIPAGVGDAALLTLAHGHARGIRTPLHPEEGEVRLKLSEQPVFLEYTLKP